MKRCEQPGIVAIARKARLYRRGRTRGLSGRDADDQDSEITRKNGDLGIAIETGKTQVQRDTRGSLWKTRCSARG